MEGVDSLYFWFHVFKDSQASEERKVKGVAVTKFRYFQIILRSLIEANEGSFEISGTSLARASAAIILSCNSGTLSCVKISQASMGIDEIENIGEPLS